MGKYTVPFLTLLTPGQHAGLQAASVSEGCSMADVLRDALDMWLAQIQPGVNVEVWTDDLDDAEDYEPVRVPVAGSVDSSTGAITWTQPE